MASCSVHAGTFQPELFVIELSILDAPTNLVKATRNWAVGQFEFLMAFSLVDGVIPSTGSGQALTVAVLQAERRACPEPWTVVNGR